MGGANRNTVPLPDGPPRKVAPYRTPSFITRLTGEPLAPLKFPDQNTESERSAFGAKASYQWKVSHVTVIPQVSAAWQHEYGDTAYSIVSSFASGAGKSFTVTGPDIGRDSILVGAGATVIWNERVSTYLYYDGEFARTNYLSNNVSGGVRLSF